MEAPTPTSELIPLNAVLNTIERKSNCLNLQQLYTTVSVHSTIHSNFIRQLRPFSLVWLVADWYIYLIGPRDQSMVLDKEILELCFRFTEIIPVTWTGTDFCAFW